MKKRLLSTLLALCVALALLPGTAMAADAGDVAYPVTGGNIYFDAATGTVTGCDVTVTAAVIPAEIGGVPVTAIGDSAFAQCEDLTSVVIPDGVTSIGAFAFQLCGKLTGLELPDSVTSIRTTAFEYCRSLTSMVIPDGVTDIDPWVFSGCSGLTSVVIPDSVTDIGAGAFSNCESLTTLTIPDSVTSIGQMAFQLCVNLTSVHLSENLESISSKMFASCHSLTSLTIPKSVRSVSAEAFTGCRLLTSFKLSEENPYLSVSDGVVFDHEGKTLMAYPTGRQGAYRIPDGVTTIRFWAFFGCGGLTSLVIPEGVTDIGMGAFAGCSSLTSLTIPKSVTTVDTSSFMGCNSVRYVYYSGTEAQWKALSEKYYIEGRFPKDAEIIFNSTGPDEPEPPAGSAFSFDFAFGGLDPQTGDLKMSIVVYMNGIELLTIPLTLHLG